MVRAVSALHSPPKKVNTKFVIHPLSGLCSARTLNVP